MKRYGRGARYAEAGRAMRALFVAAIVFGTGCASVGLRGGDAVPPSFVRSTADAQSTRVVDVREGVSRDRLWATLQEAIEDFGAIDVRDQGAGFVMTTWQATVTRDGVPDFRYRTRIVARYIGPEWRQLRVRVEAQWRDRGDEWQVGYDLPLLQQVTEALQSRLGVPRQALGTSSTSRQAPPVRSNAAR